METHDKLRALVGKRVFSSQANAIAAAVAALPSCRVVFERNNSVPRKGGRTMWSGRLLVRTGDRLRALVLGGVYASQAEAVAVAVAALPEAKAMGAQKLATPVQLGEAHGAPFGLTQQQAMWLAYKIGQSLYTSGQVTSGRDILRVLHARWDQMGLPIETWADFEKAILRDDHPFSMSTLEIQRRAIGALAGDCPIGPLDRIK